MRPTNRYRSMLCLSLRIFVVTVALLATVVAADEALPPDFLTNDSVILITGAAGFIGSELAIALYRTYEPKKIICIDSMDRGFGGMTPESVLKGSAPEKNEQDLALLEFKRQRVFRMMQVMGSTVHFYRTDFRPNVPEFFEAGEVPILHRILNVHRDVTHIVHLADHYHRGSLREKDELLLTQAIPRLHAQPKAGMMETLLEELKAIKAEFGTVPHFLYASSHEVYNHRPLESLNPAPFREELPLTTPSTFGGVSKLMDEMLAQTYFDTDDIYSVGVRLFNVFGPWGLPGSPLYEMAERVVLGGDALDVDTDVMDDIRDFVFIDDAVDAIMSAMQFRPTEEQPVVFNVGTGVGRTLRSLGELMHIAVPLDSAKSVDRPVGTAKTVSYASTKRSEQVLGFKPHVSTEEGIERLLAWHFDRAFPYGSPNDKPTNHIATKGISACSKYDVDCLLGAPVYYCASECSHPKQCLTSFYDDVLMYSQQLTEKCENVMYTVALDDKLSFLPSTKVEVSVHSRSHVEDQEGSKCNIAFVSDSSPLVRRLMSEQKHSNGVLMHRFWAIVPVSVSKHVIENSPVLALLPKLAPGQFFGSATTTAIYCDPDVIIDDVPKLLKDFKTVPENANGPVATALMVGKSRDGASSRFFSSSFESEQTTVQESAYRMMRIAAIDEMNSAAFSQHVDSSFLVHALQNDDSRLFRCDILGEVVQWDVSTDGAAIQFIMGLHDMWSRVISKKLGERPWWITGNMDRKPSSEQTGGEEEEDDDSTTTDQEDADSANGEVEGGGDSEKQVGPTTDDQASSGDGGTEERGADAEDSGRSQQVIVKNVESHGEVNGLSPEEENKNEVGQTKSKADTSGEGEAIFRAEPLGHTHQETKDDIAPNEWKGDQASAGDKGHVKTVSRASDEGSKEGVTTDASAKGLDLIGNMASDTDGDKDLSDQDDEIESGDGGNEDQRGKNSRDGKSDSEARKEARKPEVEVNHGHLTISVVEGSPNGETVKRTEQVGGEQQQKVESAAEETHTDGKTTSESDGIADKGLDKKQGTTIGDAQNVGKVDLPPQDVSEKADHRRLAEEGNDDDDDQNAVDGDHDTLTGGSEEHNGFGMPEAIQEAVKAVFGETVATSPEETTSEKDPADGAPNPRVDSWAFRQSEEDARDVWMGVLSSRDLRYFARIVSSKRIGVAHLQDFVANQ